MGRLSAAAMVILGAAAVLPVAFETERLPAQAQTPATAKCAKADFESAVDESSRSLGALNHKNKPVFQSKLRQLKDKRGWTHDQFMKNAAPFVRDEKIAEFDARSQAAIEQISTLGDTGGNAAAPDCQLLAKLRAQMALLVEAQTGKWSYMFKKIDAALTK